MKRAFALAAFAVAVAVAVAAGSASAAEAEEVGFSLCNRTALTVDYAKGINVTNQDTGKPPSIEADGWHTLNPGECEVLWPGSLKYRYYLVYAAARASNRVWEGDKSVCVENGTFVLREPVCPADRNHRMFIQVDTGEFRSFTYDLN